jgi:hypothetical protein
LSNTIASGFVGGGVGVFSKQLQNLMWLLLGVSALLVALCLGWLLLRFGRTLSRVEELLETTTEGLQETLPEMRQTLGNVNDITASVNTGLGVAAKGASRAGDSMRAGWYGVRVAGRSLWTSYMDGSGVPVAKEAPRAATARRKGGAASGQ